MNEYEATIQINPTDDIKFILEESGCYESEIEMMKAGGTFSTGKFLLSMALIPKRMVL